MPKLGLGLSLPQTRVFGPSYDPDASSYFTTAGITNATAKTQINDFVKGIKDLGLWSSMVSWPVRSTQNVGAGLTAYSLGGLQSASTIFSGGSWGTNGFSLTNEQQGSASISSINQDATLMICAAGDGSTYGSYPHFLGIQSASAWGDNELVLASNGGPSDMQPFVRNSVYGVLTTASGIANSLSGATAFAFHSAQFIYGTSISAKNHKTNTSVSISFPASGTSTLNRVQLNGRWDGSLALTNPMTVSFFVLFAPNVSSSTDSIYSLYKTTLGSGLGLP